MFGYMIPLTSSANLISHSVQSLDYIVGHHQHSGSLLYSTQQVRNLLLDCLPQCLDQWQPGLSNYYFAQYYLYSVQTNYALRFLFFTSLVSMNSSK
jgi:hypothetical protein